MKISITGHTSGIGKALFGYFKQEHECVGFSKSTGHNITDATNRASIISASIDCDIFVNNAYSNYDDSQLFLLQGIYNAWKDQDKIIINISSRITDFPINEKEAPVAYYTTKGRQDSFCLGKRSFPQIINLKLGMTDTPRVNFVDRQKMQTDDIVDIVKFALENRHRFRLTTITAGL